MKLECIVKVAVLATLALAGCDNDPAAGKTAAKVAEPTSDPTPPPQDTAGTVRYTFSHANSKVAFVGAKVTGKHDGSFGDFAGTLYVPADKLEDGRVDVTLKSASIEADEAKLTKHLKSEDFFDVEKFPEVRFVSTRVTPQKGEGGATHEVTGNLTMHGVTKAITFPATLRSAEGAVEVDAEFAIDRKDFGIVYPGMPDDLIKDEVLIKLDLLAARDQT